MYNATVQIVNNPNAPQDVVNYGKMIISQYNTATGSSVMKSTLESFCEEHKVLCKSMWVIHNGVEMRISRYSGTLYTFADLPYDSRKRMSFLKEHKIKQPTFELEISEIIFKDYLVD